MTPRGVTYFGLVINLLLTLSKVLVGWLANSRALVADGLHSLSDLASDVAVLWGLRKSDEPPDADHPYGHRRFQTSVGLAIAVLLFAGAVYVIVDSLISWHETDEGPNSWWAFWVAVASIVLKEILFQLTWVVGERQRDAAVLANAWHHRSDAFSSIAAAAGIGGTLIGGPSWGFLDHVAAIVLAAFLLAVGWRIGRQAMDELMDRAPAPRVIRQIEAIVARVPGVSSYHAVRARRVGGRIEMDIHIQVDGEISVHDGHEIAAHVKHSLREANLGVESAIVHVEPREEEPGKSDMR